VSLEENIYTTYKYNVLAKRTISGYIQNVAGYIQNVAGGIVSILGGHSVGHSKQKVYVYMCPIPNGFRDRAISLYTSQIVDKKEMLRTVSNTGIYCSSDKVGTVT
jgi:hypothetical protein